jgi:hypothetical protein
MTLKKGVAAHLRNKTYRPGRHQHRAPEGGIGPAPKHLDAELVSVWRELAAAVPTGVSAPHDRAAFELLVRLTARMRAGRLNGSECSQLRQLFAGFAMLPAGRQALDVAPPLSDEAQRVAAALQEFEP